MAPMYCVPADIDADGDLDVEHRRELTDSMPDGVTVPLRAAADEVVDGGDAELLPRCPTGTYMSCPLWSTARES
ncbi:hypothetical protein [Actinophytocola sp.]|uniref:hypothetical protein n=1 Tax=Actinophytocola sp. TaxID=1872138 RepID=UPI00389A546B